MKKMILVLLAAAATLGGCSVMQGMTAPLHKEVTPEQKAAETQEQTALRIARDGVDELYGLLASANKTIGNNVEAAIWTPQQGQRYLNKSKSLRLKVDEAKKAVNAGNVSNANLQAEAIKKLILELHKEIALQARSGEIRIEVVPIFT